MKVQIVIKCCYLLCYTYFIAFLLVVAKINATFMKLDRNEEGSILNYPILLHTNYDVRSPQKTDTDTKVCLLVLMYLHQKGFCKFEKGLQVNILHKSIYENIFPFGYPPSLASAEKQNRRIREDLQRVLRGSSGWERT